MTSDPVFVISGAATASVGAPLYMDHLVDALPPVAALGTNYLVVAFRGRTVGDIVRVIGQHQVHYIETIKYHRIKAGIFVQIYFGSTIEIIYNNN